MVQKWTSKNKQVAMDRMDLASFRYLLSYLVFCSGNQNDAKIKPQLSIHLYFGCLFLSSVPG